MQEAEGTSLQPGTLPELPLPALDSNATKVLLGAKPQPPQGMNRYIYNGGLTFPSLNFLSGLFGSCIWDLSTDANRGFSLKSKRKKNCKL